MTKSSRTSTTGWDEVPIHMATLVKNLTLKKKSHSSHGKSIVPMWVTERSEGSRKYPWKNVRGGGVVKVKGGDRIYCDYRVPRRTLHYFRRLSSWLLPFGAGEVPQVDTGEKQESTLVVLSVWSSSSTRENPGYSTFRLVLEKDRV